MSYQPPDPITWKLRLYIAGNHPESQRVKENIFTICQNHLNGSYYLEVIDVLKAAHQAKEAGIVTVPTLVRQTPAPTRMLVGNLADPTFVFHALGIGHSGSAPAPEFKPAFSEPSLGRP